MSGRSGSVRTRVVGAVVLLAAAGRAVASRLLAPLARLRAAAQRSPGTGLRQHVEVPGDDEVGPLARAVDDPLDRSQSAVDTQSCFLDDLGHELRTPLTIVRGHLELLDPADPADVRATRALVLDELDRTARLVEDLVLLGRAQQPGQVRPAPVDLAALTGAVLEEARALGDRRWVSDGAADAVVALDAPRVVQALLQLAGNAVRYAGPAATIAVGSSVDGTTVRLWVRDDGPGIAPEQAGRVFEPFARGGAAGRPGEGSGLGLAVARAVAAAHGGDVELSSVPGAGARFTLVLPGAAAVLPADDRELEGSSP